MEIISTSLWTSNLTVLTDIQSLSLNKYIKDQSYKIESRISRFNSNSTINLLTSNDKEEFRQLIYDYFNIESVSFDDVWSFANYKHNGQLDLTGLTKGLFIEKLVQILTSVNSQFIINFGGDGAGFINKVVTINDGHINHIIPANSKFSYCTSVNNGIKRGNHILGDNKSRQVTLISTEFTTTYLDMMATRICSGEQVNLRSSIRKFIYSKPADIENKIIGVY